MSQTQKDKEGTVQPNEKNHYEITQPNHLL